MIKNLYIKFAFNLTILLTIIFFYNFLHAEEIYFDLSEDSIELKTDFNGKEIIIFLEGKHGKYILEKSLVRFRVMVIQ